MNRLLLFPKKLLPLLCCALTLVHLQCTAQKSGSTKNTNPKVQAAPQAPILPGAAQLDQYLPLLQGKGVALFANLTSTVGNTHLVDTLRKKGVNIKVIFGPEHGFRGNAQDGEKVESTVDRATGIPIVSLYGKKRKPSAEDLKGVDVLVFDIQDVGTRFYTFISSLQDYMETALEFNLPLVVLDRPNPNGFYVDGPVLEEKFKSFVGMQPVPVVYGMTMGEYATMILNEQWLSKEANAAYRRLMTARYAAGATYFSLTVIPCAHYTHASKYVLPVAPSPNLPRIQNIYIYPSTCFFEGTPFSEGRGTTDPFLVFGHPSLPKNLYSFTPRSIGTVKNPKQEGKVCYGWNLGGTPEAVLQRVDNRIQLKWLLEAYRLFPDKKNFFITTRKENPQETDYHFNRLAGNATLMQQIKAGVSEENIRKSWQPKLEAFKKIRKKYLLYPDNQPGN
ncbi:DUF1343 domain-containing protein [Paraflavisolibacter sp. H34]|uniref:exo-beta-N-acetylmuramidase NamZ family protein n=1 Tax=Huijunlia imazamoxiresistens TaxID=3127457 RepID=UPI00301B6AD3